LNAEISGNCIPIGFQNSNFFKAARMQLLEDHLQADSGKDSCCKEGVKFNAFFIPATAKSVIRKGDKPKLK
jgi:hypothetical protein